jgi:hypothetical protein
MLRFLKEHRAWLPSAKKGTRIKRDLTETEIRKWRVDVGLSKPSVLMTQVAKDLQKVYNQEPDMNFCDSQGALEKWREFGPVRLSWIAQHARVPIDLDDEKHELKVFDDPEAREQLVINKDGSLPPVCLARHLSQEGNLIEG